MGPKCLICVNGCVKILVICVKLSGVDPGLDFGEHLIHFIVFSCEKCLTTMVNYRKYCCL